MVATQVGGNVELILDQGNWLHCPAQIAKHGVEISGSSYR